VRRMLPVLLIGDTIVFLLATLLGFASHAELSPGRLNRMAATFFPFLAAWLLTSPWMGVYDRRMILGGSGLIRPFAAAVIAAPFGAFLRGVWFSAPVIPLFVVIMGGVTALLMFVWRGCHRLLLSRRPAVPPR
jgi:hypothetical protein